MFADTSLHESGFIQFLLPRFSLKSGVKIDVQEGGMAPAVFTDADVVITSTVFISGYSEPVAVFRQAEIVFYVITSRAAGQDEGKTLKINRFVEWLGSEVGMRTINQFRLAEEQVYDAIEQAQIEKPARIFTGSISAGEDLAYRNCGRCHVVGSRNPMAGIGSTPSFSLMRTFNDWERRFEGFFTLRPHPSFSQIVDVTEDFPDASPPAIFPLFLTIDELNDILAFVATIEPADLGAPLQIGN